MKQRESPKIFCGIKYYRQSTGYYSASYKHPLPEGVERSMHREVWRRANGEIPKGFVIHHKDEDKGNNELNNLKCLKAGEHNSLHIREYWAFAPKKRFRCSHCGKSAIMLNKGIGKIKIYCSKKCCWAAKDKRRSTRESDTPIVNRPVFCLHCGTLYMQETHGRRDPKVYCSKRCKRNAAKARAHRRKRALDATL